MKNKGYTLLELLGVIILLALLTILVFPSVINTIKRTNDKTDELSMKLINNAADLYIKNNEDNFIEDNHVNIIKYNGNQYVIEIEDLLNDGNLPESIKLSDNKDIRDKCVEALYKNNKFVYTLKDKGTCNQITKLESICTSVSGTERTMGSKYLCKVDPNQEPYTFYVLTTPERGDKSINLIMEQNICEDGSQTKSTKSDKCFVAWNSSGEVIDGPVTAMTYLHNATKSWTNVPAVNYEYYDRQFNGNSSQENVAYESLIVKNGIVEVNGERLDIDKLLRARLPIYTENPDNKFKSEVANSNGINEFLYENLDANYSAWNGAGSRPTNNIDQIYGYWTLSSVNNNTDVNVVYAVRSSGKVSTIYEIFLSQYYGVRPVITLDIVREELPKEYQEVEYIESTGTQYINTLYKDDMGCRYVMNLELTSLTGSYQMFTGCEYSSPYWRNQVGCNSAGQLHFGYYNAYTVNKTITVGNKYNFDVSATVNNPYYRVDNEDITPNISSINTLKGADIYIFAQNRADNDHPVLAYNSRIKLYSYKLYSSDNILVRDMMPCYRKSDGVIGMYDLVNDKFYTNSGTGTFLKGKDI